jgi:hypothetical protein
MAVRVPGREEEGERGESRRGEERKEERAEGGARQSESVCLSAFICVSLACCTSNEGHCTLNTETKYGEACVVHFV